MLVQLRGWRRALAACFGAAILAIPLGEDAQALALLALAVVGGPAILRAVRVHRPQHRSPWFWFAAAIGFFLLGAIVREVELALAGGVEHYPSLADVLDALGYGSAIVSVRQLGRLRSHRSDPTNLVDSLIVVGGVGVVVWVLLLVPYLGDESFPLSARVVDLGFSLLSLTLGVGTARIAIGPGARNRSYYLLAAAVFSAFAADLWALLDKATHDPVAGQVVLSLLLPSLGFAGIAAAALEPSMVDLTTESTVPVGRMTNRRLALMTAAVLVPPTVLLVDAPGGRLSGGVVIVSWLVLSALMMVRVAGLVRAREKAGHVEAVLRRAAASLVSATDTGQMHTAAMAAMRELAGSSVRVVSTSVVVRGAGGWTAAAEEHGASAWFDPAALDRVLPSSSTEPVMLTDATPYTAVVVAPMVSKNELRGALVLVAATELDQLVVDALEALAADVSLALETATLTADLHRRRSERRFRALIENSTDVVIMVQDGRVSFVSPAAERLLGHRDLVGEAPELTTLLYPDDRPGLLELVEEARSTGRPAGPLELRLFDADGEPHWFEATVAELQGDADVAGTVFNAREIADRVAARAVLERSEARFRSLAQHSSDIVAVLDDSGSVSYMSPSSAHVLGYEPEELLGGGLARVVHEEDRLVLSGQLPMLATSGRTARTTELRVTAADGEEKTLELTVSDLRHEPSVVGIVLNAHDITDRKALERDLRHRTLHDDLTGIGNRVLFRERVEHALSGRADDATTTAICFVDLDDFKTINDGLGHDAGDEVLSIVAHRLTSFLRAGDTAARLGGDEFAILLERTDPQAALEVAERLLAELREPVEMGGRTVVIGASIGLAFADPSVSTAEVVLRNADVAMYHAKRGGKGAVHVFDEAMYQSAFERLELKGDLENALAKGELHLEYQPLISLSSSIIIGFEALLRWHHPHRGRVSPATFIPIAEQTGAIVPIGRWVLQEAFRQLRRWQEGAGGSTLTMNVNLSPRQLDEPGIVDDVREALWSTGVDAPSVTLELTEGIPLEAGRSREHLLQLRALGVGIAADDFGAGFASYAALQQLPFTSVKVDRTLIEGLDQDETGKAKAQVRSIISMAHATGLHAVAEGIERPGQRTALVELGCDLGQGYLLGSPAPADTMESVLEASRAEILTGRR
jgi:diguanylate cyclase (GGDEF)-like protein/PAS domain S-box-containing protein